MVALFCERVFSGKFRRDNLNIGLGVREWDGSKDTHIRYLESNFQRLERDRTIGKKKGVTAAQIALAFYL